jgi:hypothetical protein
MTEETRFPDENEIKKYAHTTKNILEKNGIYPMYHDDERLRDYPKLQQRFIKTDDRSVKYPGLFLRIKEEYVVFGAYIGTR